MSSVDIRLRGGAEPHVDARRATASCARVVSAHQVRSASPKCEWLLNERCLRGAHWNAGSLPVISMIDMKDTDVPVLIVGGSLVGMFMAALLARLGVKALVAERHASTAIHPRAAFVYQRSMEVVRGLGVEEVVRQKSFQQFEPDGAIL